MNKNQQPKYKVGDTIRRRDGKSVYIVTKVTPYGYKCEGVFGYIDYKHQDNYELCK